MGDKPMLKCDELCWLNLPMNGPSLVKWIQSIQYFENPKPETNDEINEILYADLKDGAMMISFTNNLFMEWYMSSKL